MLRRQRRRRRCRIWASNLPISVDGCMLLENFESHCLLSGYYCTVSLKCGYHCSGAAVPRRKMYASRVGPRLLLHSAAYIHRRAICASSENPSTRLCSSYTRPFGGGVTVSHWCGAALLYARGAGRVEHPHAQVPNALCEWYTVYRTPHQSGADYSLWSQCVSRPPLSKQHGDVPPNVATLPGAAGCCCC